MITIVLPSRDTDSSTKYSIRSILVQHTSDQRKFFENRAVIVCFVEMGCQSVFNTINIIA